MPFHELQTLLSRRADERPEALALTIEGHAYTWGALRAEVGRCAAGLAARGVVAGDRVGLLLGNDAAFPVVFFACWWLGAIPVPLAPPRPGPGAAEPAAAELARVARALAISGARLAVVTAGPSTTAEGPCPLVLAGDVLAVSGLEGPVAPLELALMQFSSGSTGGPKGVVLTAEALAANLDGLTERFGAGPADVACAWLPLHHDMGLIGSLLLPLRAGFPVHVLAPERFIREPASWPVALSRVRATITGGPTFGYALAARLPARATVGVDLSSVRVALVGAEPVHAATMAAFTRRYAPHGFSARALLPAYGLAEATLAVTLTSPGEGVIVDHVSREALARDHEARVTPEGVADARSVVALGTPLAGVRLSIRDAAGSPLPDRQAGEVWVQSPATMTGYWGDADATAEALPGDGWLRTGDLGYLAEGRLHLCGRLKDVIVRAGRKYHAADLEALAERVAGVRSGGAAAFAVGAADDQVERVVLLVEPRTEGEDPAPLLAEVRRCVLEAVGLRLDEVVAVPARTLPRTTSGKLQRGLARAAWLRGPQGALRG
jgi:acyl-CoA synthetase (AMP-forming)/AMP-acid ligase II